MRFSEKTVFITGAAQGIGECAAWSFAREGAMVVVTDIKTSLVRQLSESINGAQGHSISFGLDVTNSEEINRVVRESIARLSKIDIFVHSAGIFKGAYFLDMSEQQWDEMLKVNLKGTFLCCQSIAREMIKKRSGKIFV